MATIDSHWVWLSRICKWIKKMHKRPPVNAVTEWSDTNPFKLVLIRVNNS